MSSNRKIGLYLQDVAHCANHVARATPLMTESERDSINAYFNQPSDQSSPASNCARLCDELARDLLQVAGGHLYSIGTLIQHERVSLPPISVLARAAIEASGRCMWLIDPTVQEQKRAERALRLLKTRIGWLENKLGGGITKEAWNRDIKRTIKAARQDEEIPADGQFFKNWSVSWNRDNLFQINIDELLQLHDWVHSNDAALLTFSLRQDQDPRRNIYFTHQAAALCALIVSQTTKVVATRKHTDNLEETLENTQNFSTDFYTHTHEPN